MDKYEVEKAEARPGYQLAVAEKPIGRIRFQSLTVLYHFGSFLRYGNSTLWSRLCCIPL